MYAADEVIATWGPIILDPGNLVGEVFIEIEWHEDLTNELKGVEGGSVGYSNDHGADILIHCLPDSPALAAFTLAIKTRLRAPFFLTDKRGSMLYTTESAHLKKRANITLGRAPTERVYTLTTFRLEGGDLPIPS